MAGDDLPAALAHLQQAAARFEALGDMKHHGRAICDQAAVLSALGRTAEADQASGQALALARHCDDLLSQGNALNMLTFHLADQAQALKLYRQASAAFGAAGSLGGQMTVLGNTGDAYRELGLARRARRLIAEACPLARHAGMQQALFSHLQNRFDIEWHTGALGAARDTAAEATAMQSRRNVGFPAYAAGQIALVEGQPAAAARLFEQAAEADSASDAGYAMASLGQAGRAHLAAGQRSEALAATRRSTGLHPAAGLAKLNGGYSVALWWAHCLALRANGQRAEAGEALALACRFVLEAAQGLSDEGLRRSLLNKRAEHREVVRAWLQHARKLPRAQREAHLAGESQPREPFERLVDTGLRGHLLAMLAAQAAVALANLRTAEARAAQAQAEQRASELAIINSIQQGVAGSLDFQGIVELVGDKLREVLKSEDVGITWFDVKTGLLHTLYAIEHGQRLVVPPRQPTPGDPWEQMVQSRQAYVVNSHAEMAAADVAGVLPGTDLARSFLKVPIIGSDRVLGFIDLEDHLRDNAYGEAEVRLVTTVAASMGVALENARLFDETQQRAAELDTINKVSQQVAGKLDLAALIELVGEQIRQVFKADLAYVALLDRASGAINFPYQYGEENAPIKFGEGLTSKIIETREALNLNCDVNRRSQEMGTDCSARRPCRPWACRSWWTAAAKARCRARCAAT